MGRPRSAPWQKHQLYVKTRVWKKRREKAVLLNCQTPNSTCCGILRAISIVSHSASPKFSCTPLFIERTLQGSFCGTFVQIRERRPLWAENPRSTVLRWPFFWAVSAQWNVLDSRPHFLLPQPSTFVPWKHKMPNMCGSLAVWPNLVLIWWAWLKAGYMALLAFLQTYILIEALNSDCSVGRRNTERDTQEKRAFPSQASNS